METKKVKEVMTMDLCLISPESTVSQAAQKMKEMNCGILPVETKDNVLGMLSDRDIVVRMVAEGLDGDSTQVKDIMTPQAFACSEDNTLQEAADEMAKHKVGRLLVKGKQNKVTGILSFGGIVRHTPDQELVSDIVIHAVSKQTDYIQGQQQH